MKVIHLVMLLVSNLSAGKKDNPNPVDKLAHLTTVITNQTEDITSKKLKGKLNYNSERSREQLRELDNLISRRHAEKIPEDDEYIEQLKIAGLKDFQKLMPNLQDRNQYRDLQYIIQSTPEASQIYKPSPEEARSQLDILYVAMDMACSRDKRKGMLEFRLATIFYLNAKYATRAYRKDTVTELLNIKLKDCNGLPLNDSRFTEILSEIFDDLWDAIKCENTKAKNHYRGSSWPSYEYKSNLVAEYLKGNTDLPERDSKMEKDLFIMALAKPGTDVEKVYKTLIDKTYLELPEADKYIYLVNNCAAYISGTKPGTFQAVTNIDKHDDLLLIYYLLDKLSFLDTKTRESFIILFGCLSPWLVTWQRRKDLYEKNGEPRDGIMYCLAKFMAWFNDSKVVTKEDITNLVKFIKLLKEKPNNALLLIAAEAKFPKYKRLSAFKVMLHIFLKLRDKPEDPLSKLIRKIGPAPARPHETTFPRIRVVTGSEISTTWKDSALQLLESSKPDRGERLHGGIYEIIDGYLTPTGEVENFMELLTRINIRALSNSSNKEM